MKPIDSDALDMYERLKSYYGDGRRDSQKEEEQDREMTKTDVYEVLLADVEMLANAIIIYPVLAKNPKESWTVGPWFFMYCDDYIRLSPRLVSARITLKGFFEVLNEITKDACEDERLSKFNIRSDISFDSRWNNYKSLLYKIEEKQNGSC